jgi:hypothetical protein
MSRPRSSLLFPPLALLWLGATTASTPAPVPEISVQPSVRISADEPTARHVESWLAVNPRDSRNLIAASIVFGERDGVAAYASRDGGKSWVRATHGARPERVFDGIDPAVAFDPDGNAYLVTSQVAVWKSTDGGFRWGERALVPGSGWDRPFIGCDTTGREPLRGRIYLAGKLPITVFGHPGADVIAVSTSRDGGASFGFPRLILPAPEKELLNIVSDLQVAPDGGLILVLQTFAPQNFRAPLLNGSYSTIVSGDGGRGFSEPRPVADFRTYGHAAEGKSLLGLGGARLAVDTSDGPRRGRLYLTWLDAIDGYYQVMAAASGDGGKQWSAPVRVSDNRTPTDPSNPAIAVNDEGVVGISWNDRRNDPTNRCYQLFFAASVDGGASFSANRRIEEQFTCPIGQPPRAGSSATPAPDPSVDPIGSEYRFKNGGDTQGIVGLPHGAFHLAWINGGSGELQLESTVALVRRRSPAAARR